MRAVRSLLPLACLTVAVVAAGCSDDDAEAPGVAALAGNTYTSTSVEGYEMVAGTNVTMTFDEDGVAVNAGCNTLRGGITIEDGTLQVGAMAQTMMACSDDLMAQDTALAAFFTSGPTITLDDGTLVLTSADTTITAEETDD